MYFSIPYSKGVSKLAEKTVKNVNSILPNYSKVRVSYATLKSGSFFHNKDRVPDCLRSNIVHVYNYGQCTNCSYIGETTRNFSVRIKEHITGKPTPTEVTLHNHSPQSQNFKVLCNSRYTRIAESIVLSLSKDKESLLNDFTKSYPLQLFPPLS